MAPAPRFRLRRGAASAGGSAAAGGRLTHVRSERRDCCVSGPGTLEAGSSATTSGRLGGVTSKQFVDRSSTQLSAGVEGQRAQAANQINDERIRRGMFKFWGARRATAAAGRAWAVGLRFRGSADILKGAEQQDLADEIAANQRSSLLGANRQWTPDTAEDRPGEERRSRRSGEPHRSPTT